MEGVGYSGGIQSGAMVSSLLDMTFSHPISAQRPLASEQETHAAAGFPKSLSHVNSHRISIVVSSPSTQSFLGGGKPA